MKSLLLGGSIALVLMVPACKKPESGATAPPASAPEKSAAGTTSGETKPAKAKEEARPMKVADRAAREEFSTQMKSAYGTFSKKDIAAAMKTLDEVPEEFRNDPGFLTLRGACHVERRDFKAALADFKEAAKSKPGDPSIRFNIAEISFVLHDWEEASKGFQVLQSQGAGDGAAAALVDFKLMLCEEGRGNAAEFDRRAAENMADADSLLAAYTKAAMEFRAQNAEEAKATLADAAERFPRNADRAPWHDTMIEFGYDPRK